MQIAPGRQVALNGVEWTVDDVHGQLGRLVLVDGDGRAETRSFRWLIMPHFVMRTAGLIVPIAREMAEMDYQWYAPFHMDATEAADTFRLTATDFDFAVRNEVG
ncbi:hypothetical protein [Streptomyces sp. NPDC048825]|uniref:hypothetical protein n=1 Tax=Streptomyces sp. NPDC048825 TaxID=3365592 RepID=UPI00371A0C6C